MKKRLFAGLLALCMTVNLMSATAFAEGASNEPAVECTTPEECVDGVHGNACAITVDAAKKAEEAAKAKCLAKCGEVPETHSIDCDFYVAPEVSEEETPVAEPVMAMSLDDEDVVAAAINDVAQIGDKKYESLAAAVAAATNGAVVTLLDNVEQQDGIIIEDKNMCIDLNGKTFTVTEGASTNNRNFKITGSSVVTIKNGTMVAEGDYSSGAYGTVRTEGAANVTLTGLKLYNYRGNGLNIKALSGTTVSIDNTKIYAEYGGGVEAAGGTITLAETVKIEQEGMYTAPYNSMAISVNGGGKAVVNGGTYSTECITAEEANNQGTSHGPWAVGVLNSGGTLVINGGTFSNDNFGEDSLATAARGLVLADTGAVIEINGGNFDALKNIIDIQNNLGDTSKQPRVEISGGNFSADPKAITYKEHIEFVDGAKYTINGVNYKYTSEGQKEVVAKIDNEYYETLQDAINAAEAGATITLLNDVILASDIDATGKTVNLNGNTLTGRIVGVLDVNGGKLIDPVIGVHISSAGDGKYKSADGVFTITPNSVSIDEGLVEIANNWRTLPGQTISIGKDATFVVPDGKKFEVFSTVTVEAGANISGKITLGGTTYEPTAGVVVTDATITAPAGIDIVSGVDGYGVVYSGGKYQLVDLITTDDELTTALAAAEEGDVLKLGADITTASIVVVDKAITIDGNGYRLTSSAERAINVKGASGITIKNITINASGERAINVIQNATNVTIEKVTATAANYTVNVASSAPNAKVDIKSSQLTGLCTVNVSSEGADVTVSNSTINCNDNNTTVGESYAALALNKEAIEGKITATNCTINVVEGSDSVKARNGAEDGVVTIDGSDKDVLITVAVITYEGSSYYYSFATLEEAVEFAKTGDKVTVIRDVTIENLVVPTGKTITLDLKEHKVTGYISSGSFANDISAIVAPTSHVVEKNGVYEVHAIKAVTGTSPSCTSSGIKDHYKCDTCGKTYSDAAGKTVLTDLVASAKGHKMEGTGSDSGYHWSVCTRCGATGSRSSHSYSNGKCSCGHTVKVEVYVPETPAPAPTTPAPTTTTTQTTTQTTTITKPVEEAAKPVETPVEEVVVDTKIVEEVASEEVKEAVKETVTVAETKEVEKETGTVTEVKVAVTTETVDKVIENTEAGATVILPLTEVAEEGQAVTEAEVAVEALEKIVEAEAALTVEFEGVKVTFESETIKAIAEQAQGSTIELRVVPVEHHELNEEQQAVLEEHDVAVRVSAQIFSDGEYIGDFKGGKATIAIPFTPEEGKAAEDHKVYFVDDNGEMTLMPAVYVDGHMVFETNHFSDYVIVYEEVAEAEVEEEAAVEEEAVVETVEEETEKAGLPIVPIIIIVVAIILVVAFVATRKRNDEE